MSRKCYNTDVAYNEFVLLKGADMVKDFCEKLAFPTEATVCLTEAYSKIVSEPEALSLIYKAMDIVYTVKDNSFVPLLQEISEKTGIHRYTSDLVFWIMSAKPLYCIYNEKKLPENLYWDAMADLRYKLMECYNLHGIWGVFSTWFLMFYTLERMTFGRLHYDVLKWGGDAYRGFLMPGDTYYRCHIPSSGPLTPESVMDSLKKAYTYYKDDLKNGLMSVACNSWLLYPPVTALFGENSNTKKFCDLFDLIGTKEDPMNRDFWRVFNKEYKGPETLREITAEKPLQKNLKEYLEAGNSFGIGYGILLFDGEKVINYN